MKSTITKLYDYLNIGIPPEYQKWRVTDKEIDESLTLCSKNHAILQKTDKVQCGDAVSCAYLESGGPGRTILLYPGRRLPGAEEAEKAVVGRHVNETFSCLLGKTLLTLKIKEILRLKQHPIDDCLVQLANIQNIKTVKEYRSWYIHEHEPQKQLEAAQALAKHFLNVIRENSEFMIDNEEMQSWCEQEGRLCYEHALQLGDDPHIPDDGLEFLSDEEALARMIQKQEPAYLDEVIYQYLAEQDGFQYTMEMFQRETVDLPAQQRDTQTGGDFLWWQGRAYKIHAFELLTKEAVRRLEE